MVHQFKNNGYNIALDVNTGAVHVLDDVSYEALSLWKDHTPDEVVGILETKYEGLQCAEAVDEIRTLEKEGVLFSEDAYEEYIGTIVENKAPVVKALCLHIAHGCNLSCRYCFAGDGKYHGDEALMPYEVGKAALDFLVENSGSRRNLEVDFFGGEPLLNFNVIKDLVAYGRSIEKEKDKHFRFTLTTNGVLLDEEVMEFANAEMSNLVLSIDGRQEVHDRMRPFRGGRGSFGTIQPKLLEAAKKRGDRDYYVRGTYTHFNTDFSEDVKALREMGFDRISVEPVVAPSSEDYAIRDEDIPKLLDQYDELASYMADRRSRGMDFTFFHFMIDLEGGPCVAKRLTGCGSGTEYLAVTPSGDLYPCHQFVGNDSFIMGNVFDGIKNHSLRGEFSKSNVYAKEKCRDCFAKFYCSGGCAANSFNATGNINGTYETGCTLQKKRVECAIMLKVDEVMRQSETTTKHI